MGKRITRFALVVSAAGALVLPAAASAGGTVPYRGVDFGTWAVGTEPCDGSFVINTSGVGTPVGRYTYSSHECATGLTTYAGAFTVTTTRGATLVGTYAGTVTVDAAGNAFYEQTNTVTGGTGRFAGASGSFHVSGIAFASGLDVQRAGGAISLPRADADAGTAQRRDGDA
jgi:hypothetical protein